MYKENNPIRSINGEAVKCPDSYVYSLKDISASDAGRTEDTKMHKMRIGQIVHIELSWQYVLTAEISDILKKFNPEYVELCYLDALEGKYVTSEFYVGDRSAPLYNSKKGLWQNVSFNLIERTGI